MHESIQISTPEGTFRGHVVRPTGTHTAVVVVLPEVFGVNADMRQTCEEVAALGYIALCPDLLWRLEPGVDISDRTPAELSKALALYTAFNVDTGVDDVARAIQAARTLPGANGKVGLMGFCLGGLMSFLTTARVGADAAVAYYPGNADKYLDETVRIDGPLLVHLGQEDEYIPQEARMRIERALELRPTVRTYSYPGCSHAFARHSGSRFDAAAAALANQRSASFLASYLR
jgi:carboxymethylenebutenolidase